MTGARSRHLKAYDEMNAFPSFQNSGLCYQDSCSDKNDLLGDTGVTHRAMRVLRFQWGLLRMSRPCAMKARI